jgi:FtsP/CotA-like multicopper oxidase with cupredoxin domain
MTLPPRSLPQYGAVPRRRFIQGIGAAGTLAAMTWLHRRAFAATRGAPLLDGRDFALEIGPVPLNVTGRPRMAVGVNGQVPAPILRWREGDTVTLSVTNRLSEPSSIHWHGIRTPSRMDGVPGFSFAGIAPGEAFTYRHRATRRPRAKIRSRLRRALVGLER